jgi:hypothetical protein
VSPITGNVARDLRVVTKLGLLSWGSVLDAKIPPRSPIEMSASLERAIQENRAVAVSAILKDEAFDINARCDPQRYGSVSPLTTALRTNTARFVAAITAHPRFDLARSLPDYER